jgi:hypothetical protein
MNEKALSAYVQAMGQIEKYLSELQALANDHLGNDPENINWGHVGSAIHLAELLKEAADFASNRAN